MKTKILCDNVVYYENLIDDLNHFINLINDVEQENINIFSNWKPWYASNADVLYGEFRESSFTNILNNCNEKSSSFIIAKTLKSLIDFCVEDYCKKTNQESGHMPDHFTIRKYNTKAYMGPHVDTEDIYNTKQPSISMVFYLNDDYDGGEIEFPNQSIKIKPSAGSLIIFPSYQPYMHDPKPTTSGLKYMIPLFWFKEKFW
jgi:hypothetical protein